MLATKSEKTSARPDQTVADRWNAVELNFWLGWPAGPQWNEMKFRSFPENSCHRFRLDATVAAMAARPPPNRRNRNRPDSENHPTARAKLVGRAPLASKDRWAGSLTCLPRSCRLSRHRSRPRSGACCWWLYFLGPPSLCQHPRRDNNDLHWKREPLHNFPPPQPLLKLHSSS